jgi:NAD(P)-dependent dehydrogenase (short-subunit alcohol dehydrogenase family)
VTGAGLHPDILAEATVALAAADGASDPLEHALVRLGAVTRPVTAPSDAGALVYDGRADFGSGEAAGLHRALDAAWEAVLAFAPGLIDRGRVGKIVVIAPAPDAGPFAEAVRSALENLARTLSVEWARHGITAVTILPGGATAAETVHELVAYLLSPAGGYFSGCALRLDAVAD